jgi:hypothetical protein
MAGYLPRGWTGKQVNVRFGAGGTSSLETRLVSDSEGGLIVESPEAESTRTAFIPWAAVEYVELLEEPSEGGPGVHVTQKPPGF